MCSIIGGSFGVFFGGWFSDYATKRLGVHARLWILTACLVIDVLDIVNLKKVIDFSIYRALPPPLPWAW